MNNRTVFFIIKNSEVKFYTDGFYFKDLDKFISIDEALDILLFVRGDKSANCIYIDNENELCSPEMEEFKKTVTLRKLQDFASEEFHVEEFKFKLSNGLIVSQPMWDDLLFVGAINNHNQIDDVMMKSGLSPENILFIKSHPGEIIQIGNEGIPILKSEHKNLEEYFESKYEKVNDEMIAQLSE